MIQTNLTVKDYWPQGVGYDTFCGINWVDFPQDNDDSHERLQHVIESWKFTAEQHRLDLPAVKALSCQSCNDHEKCYFVTYKGNEKDEYFTQIHGSIDKVKTIYDVDESPFELETTISIQIKGTDFDNEKGFDLSLFINRYPKKNSSVSLTYTE